MQRALFDGSSEIGAYVVLTSSYAIVGATRHNPLFLTLSEQIPTIEATINTIRTVGTLLVGNKNGLLVPNTILDYEFRQLRQALPGNVRIKRVDEKLNALGNVILCNDSVAFVHPEVDKETREVLKDVLGVSVHVINSNVLIGTYAALNNKGMLVDPSLNPADFESIVSVPVVRGTVNMGKTSIGSGMIVNDEIGFCGRTTSNVEIGIMEKSFKLVSKDME